MFEIKHLATPESLDEAYHVLISNRNNRILGGCAFLKMGNKLINYGIDLKALGLNKIQAADGWIDLGATCTYGDLTQHPLLYQYAGGLIPRALQPIVGIQLRNVVQVGASVFSRYGFSDFLPSLLVLDAEVSLYEAGRMALQAFLQQPLTRDLLTAVHLPDRPIQASCQSLRVNASDLPVVNCAVAYHSADHSWRVAIGSRPARAQRALDTENYLNQCTAKSLHLTAEQIDRAATKASEELVFGDNARASALYRQAMARVLVARGLREVTAC